MAAWSAWIVLTTAGLLEVGWAIGLKKSDGFARPVPAIIYSYMVLSIGLLGCTLRTLPIGTAYAAWTGIGTIGTVLWGIVFLDELCHPTRLFLVGVIFIGIVGLGIADWLIHHDPSR